MLGKRHRREVHDEGTVTTVQQGSEGKTMSLLAYLDPGTGSLLLQAIVGGSAGLVVFFRYVWNTYILRQNQR